MGGILFLLFIAYCFFFSGYLAYSLDKKNIFLTTKFVKRKIGQARIIAKPFMLIFAFLCFMLELLPTMLVIIWSLFYGFIKYMLNKDKNYKECFGVKISLKD